MAFASRSARYPQPSRMIRTTGRGLVILIAVPGATSPRTRRAMPAAILSLLALYGCLAQIFRRLPQLLFDPQELVVFGDAICAAGGARLDLARSKPDGEVSN